MMRQWELYSGVYAFEGIDNVGKTTIIKKLKEKIFLTMDYECVSVAFPGNESRTLGELVYDIHHNQGKYFDQPLNETSLQMLHVASHIDLVQKKLKKLLTSLKKCDRLKKLSLRTKKACQTAKHQTRTLKIED